MAVIKMHDRGNVINTKLKKKAEWEKKVLRLDEVMRIRKDKDMDVVDRTWLKFQIQGVINKTQSELGPYHDIAGAWANEPAFVVGGSYGLRVAMDDGFEWKMLDGFHSIGINHVVEDYPAFEWFIFQDKRFLSHAKDQADFDLLRDYNGRIFADVKTGLKPSYNITITYTQENKPTLNIIDGLYSYTATGLLALHLAIISGADPIYMLGLDNGGKDHSRAGAHYKTDYPCEVKGHHNWAKKYKGKMIEKCDGFNPWRNKIFNVDPYGDIPNFKKIKFSDIPELKEKRIKINQETKVCHVGVLPLEQMGTITRDIFSICSGEHVYCKLGDELPEANIYILECFKNNWFEFLTFEKPEGSKVISLVHSSEPCMPATCSDAVVTLTSYWHEKLLKNYNIDSFVIPGATKVNRRRKADYKSQVFGRITRNAPGKIHAGWNNVASTVLNKYPDSKLLMFVDNNDGLLVHDRAIYDNSIKISDGERKIKALQQMSVAVFAHGGFEEIFPIAVLECMAAGLPIISISQPSMNELIGEDQIIVDDIEQLEKELIKLLPDTERKKELGNKAQNRAKQFSHAKMQKAWNKLIMELSWTQQ